MRQRAVTFLLAFALSSRLLPAQGLYIVGGGTLSFVVPYNNDRGSTYYSEENYERSLVYPFPTFGLGYAWTAGERWQHRIEARYRRIEAGARYDSLVRPNNAGFANQFRLVKPIGLHEQGIRSQHGLLTYGLSPVRSADKRWRIAGNFSLSYGRFNQWYDYLESTDGKESVLNRELPIPDEYYRPFNASLGIGTTFRLTKLVDLVMAYESYLLPINRTVDAVMIRRHHPQVATLALRIYAKR